MGVLPQDEVSEVKVAGYVMKTRNRVRDSGDERDTCERGQRRQSRFIQVADAKAEKRADEREVLEIGEYPYLASQMPYEKNFYEKAQETQCEKKNPVVSE